MKSPSRNPAWIKYLPFGIGTMLEGRVSLLAAIHNTGWIFFDKILRAILGVLVGAWVARYLGPSQYGELAYCIAFIAIFQSITNLGLDGIVVREVANHPHKANVVLGTVFQLRLWLGICFWILATSIFGFLNSFHGQGIWIAGLVGAGMVFQAADTVDLWFQGNSQSKRTVLTKALVYLISNAIRVTMILLEAPLVAFAAVITAEGVLTALFLYISYRRFPCGDTWKRHYSEVKKLLLESWPYMVSSLAVMIYMRIDQLMIKSILGTYELGIFASIIPISNLWNMIPVGIAVSIAPFVARKRLQGPEVFANALLKMFRFFWLFCLVIIAVTWTLSSLVIRLMYGPAYEDAIPVLNIYVLTCIPIFMGVGQSLWVVNERKSYLAPLQTITGAIVCVVTNLVLLPLWGIKGAAVAAVMAQVSSSFLINSIFARNLFFMQIGFTAHKVKV